MDDRRPPDQQLGGTLEPEHLDLLGAEGRDADLGDPDRQVGDGLDLLQLGRPLIELPVVPVEREAVHRDRVDLRQHAPARHVLR